MKGWIVMKIAPFAVEEWMNEYEVGAKYNIAETCVDSISLDELFELTHTDKKEFLDDICARRLTYGDIYSKPELLKGIASLYKTVNTDEIVTCHGAAGANHHLFYSIVEPGDRVISVMPTYQQLYSIPASLGADVKVMHLEKDKNYLPDLDELRRLAVKGTKMICLNNPNNPTGYCMSVAEWQSAVDVLKEATKDETKNAILIADVAYLDYSGEKEECREFFKVFGGLPKNILVVCAYTLSKGFTMYGQRMGAMIGISSDKDVIKEYVDINQYSSRATWSNCNSAAQHAMIRICQDPEKIKQLDAERAKYYKLIQERAAIFVEEAQKEGVKFVPYISGFFITIPVTNSQAVCDILEKDHVFMVPLKKGIRLAVCSVSKKKMHGLAHKLALAIKEAGAQQ